MAEVQNMSESGEMTQRFIEFVMMQTQNAALFLGQIPNPQTGQAEVNLEVAKMFIDQLVMIRQKTDGNLTKEEGGVLNNAISNLQMVFVEVSKKGTQGTVEQAPESSAAVEPPAEKTDVPSNEEAESRKRFTKSYGS